MLESVKGIAHQRASRTMGILNILVLPGGTEIGMEIWRALKDCKEIRLYAASSDDAHHDPYVFARHFLVPDVHEPTWLETLNEVLAEQKIHYVFPAHDDVALSLAECASRLRAGIVSSPLKTCRTARSKIATYECLRGVVPLPVVYDDPASISEFPVFVKPDIGQGSGDVHLILNMEQLFRCLAAPKRYVVTEYLPGEEFTIDCFSDRERGLLFCSGRTRSRTRSGISMKSRLVHEEIFHGYAASISKKMEFHGAWFFQMKKDRQGKLKLLEVAPRIAGTMALNRVRGVNFPLLSIYEQERIPVQIMMNQVDVEIDRALVNRYRHNVRYRTVYVDLDDTLILHGRVNTALVQFLYQCVNESIRLVLLSRHDGNVERTLQLHRLGSLFDAVIQIDRKASKADYIREADAILIDDSFRERMDVHCRLGIMTFDCSMIEMLLDERV